MPSQENLASLFDIDLDEISFVDRGSNPGSKLVFYKRKIDKVEECRGITVSAGILNSSKRSVISNFSFDADLWNKEQCEAWIEKRNYEKRDISFDKENNRYNIPLYKNGVSQIRSFSLGSDISKLLDSSFSWERIQSTIRNAIWEKFGDEVYCRDIWKDQIVVEQGYGEKYYRIPFFMSSEDGENIRIDFGNPTRVKLVYIDVEEDEYVISKEKEILQKLSSDMKNLKDKFSKILSK